MKYTDIVLTVSGQIGTIKLNRPKALNSFGGNLMMDVVTALRELNEHPDTIMTVITGEGRFFSAGADVNNVVPLGEFPSAAHKKVAILADYAPVLELLRSMVDHKKVLVLALNGPAVGGAAGWFVGVADIVLASDTCWLHAPFSELGLVPEFGSAVNFAQSMGVHKANDFLMFGHQMTAQELQACGLVNQIFPTTSFHQDVEGHLRKELEVNDGLSMMESKRLMNASVRDARLLSIMTSLDALAERMVEGTPYKRFAEQRRKMKEKGRQKGKL
ncbi:hypothetical protein CLAIMM_08389 [Cladophialophora immunda]|nr:hypothetical protein CLAIMM_08389 [Cladophialophora immunda]